MQTIANTDNENNESAHVSARNKSMMIPDGLVIWATISKEQRHETAFQINAK